VAPHPYRAFAHAAVTAERALGGAAKDPWVRRASADDLDRVAPLFDAYRRFYGAAADAAAARRFLATRFALGESVVLLAIDGPRRSGDRARDLGGAVSEDIIGFAQLYRSFSSLSLGEIVILNDLFVTPAHRGRGIAGRLVDVAVEHARRVGAIGLELATQHTNAAALRLYRAKGFVADTAFTHLGLAISPVRPVSQGSRGS
jgi:GNAT superfamily N-acetyltransferase